MIIIIIIILLLIIIIIILKTTTTIIIIIIIIIIVIIIIIIKSKSKTKLGYMDDLKLNGKIHVVVEDAEVITSDAIPTSFQLNPSRCEIVASNFHKVKDFPISKDLKRIQKEDLTILRSPVLKGPALENALEERIKELERVIDGLSLLHSHDALCMLRKALAMQNLLHILRTVPRSGNNLLKQFDDTT